VVFFLFNQYGQIQHSLCCILIVFIHKTNNFKSDGVSNFKAFATDIASHRSVLKSTLKASCLIITRYKKQATEGKYDINKKAVFKMLSHHAIIHRQNLKKNSTKTDI
jgi:hypothetical protein